MLSPCCFSRLVVVCCRMATRIPRPPWLKICLYVYAQNLMHATCTAPLPPHKIYYGRVSSNVHIYQNDCGFIGPLREKTRRFWHYSDWKVGYDLKKKGWRQKKCRNIISNNIQLESIIDYAYLMFSIVMKSVK